MIIQMSDNKKEKKPGWFTKKEVTTPLMILNRILDLKGDKRLTKKRDKTSTLGKPKRKNNFAKEESDRKKREEDSQERIKNKDDKKITTIKEDKASKETVDTVIPMEFEGIDSKNQEYLKHIIPQLNAIYKAVTRKDLDEQTGENEVMITREGFDDENTIIESKTSVYVPKYIPPIKIE